MNIRADEIVVVVSLCDKFNVVGIGISGMCSCGAVNCIIDI
jgi:hypothetical protein